MSSQNENNRVGSSPAFEQLSFVCPYSPCSANSQQRWFYLTVERAGSESSVFFPKELHPFHPEQAKLRLSELAVNTNFEQSKWGALMDHFRFSNDRSIQLRPLAGLSPDEMIVADISTGKKLVIGVANLQISQCHTCKQIAIWQDGELIFPETSSGIVPSADMPPEVAALFKEAVAVLPHSPRAASALVRLCLEKLLEHLQAGDGNLFQKIGNLVDRGLDAEVAESMHALRVYGNDVIHHVSEIVESDSAETAVGLLQMLNYIVEQLITEKAKRDALIAMMPVGKKDSIRKQIDK